MCLCMSVCISVCLHVLTIKNYNYYVCVDEFLYSSVRYIMSGRYCIQISICID